jgi:hypothetical protein
MLKYLRIAVTALSLTACVLLIALWVRSYWLRDEVYFRIIPTFGNKICFDRSRIEFLTHPIEPG